jgi:O-antigen/teichoic acid export membrane protein
MLESSNTRPPAAGRRLLIARNFLSLGSGQVALALFGFVAGIYARRVLGATVIGEVAWTTSMLTYFSLLINPGLETIAQRDIAREPGRANEYVSKMTSLRLLLALISFACVCVLVLFNVRGPQIGRLLVLQGLGLLIIPLNLGWLLWANERMGVQALVATVFQMLQLLALFLLIHKPEHVYRYVLFPHPFNIAMVGVLYWCASRYRLIDWRRLRLTLRGTGALIREAIPLGFSQMASLLYFNSDAILLGFMRGDAVVGIYTTAYRSWIYGTMVFGVLYQTYFPSLARAVTDASAQRKISSEFYRLHLWLGLPLAALFWGSGRCIVNLLYGKQFVESGPMFEWLSIDIALSSFSWSIVGPLNAWGHQKKTFYITLTGALVNLGVNFLVIPRYGAMGAVATTLLAELIVLIGGLLARRKLCPLPWLAMTLKPLATAVLVAGTARWMVVAFPAHWWLALPVAGIVFAVCLWLAEKQLLMRSMREILARFR